MAWSGVFWGPSPWWVSLRWEACAFLLLLRLPSPVFSCVFLSLPGPGSLFTSPLFILVFSISHPFVFKLSCPFLSLNANISLHGPLFCPYGAWHGTVSFVPLFMRLHVPLSSHVANPHATISLLPHQLPARTSSRLGPFPFWESPGVYCGTISNRLFGWLLMAHIWEPIGSTDLRKRELGRGAVKRS